MRTQLNRLQNAAEVNFPTRSKWAKRQKHVGPTVVPAGLALEVESL